MLLKFYLVVVLKVISQNMRLYLASPFPFSLQRCPTIDDGRPLISDSSVEGYLLEYATIPCLGLPVFSATVSDY